MPIFRLVIGAFTGLCVASLHFDRSKRTHSCLALTPVGDETSDVSRTLTACMQFIDVHHEWDVESSNFDHEVSETRIQLMRLPLQFVAGDGNAVPVLRLVAFLPRVSPKEVYEQLTDLHLRPMWDINYQLYEKAPSSDTDKTPLVLQNIRRPIELVAKKVCLCDGSQCQLKPDVDVKVIDHDWYCHCVGSRMLAKVGVASRLFRYERITYKYTTVAKDTHNERNSSCAYDVLFCGSNDLVRRASALAPKIDSWFSDIKKITRSQAATMNYQHLAILPVNNFQDNVMQKMGTEGSLAEMGSMQDTQSTRNFYDLLVHCSKLEAGVGKDHNGTLIIMTSANHVKVPRAVPLWAQKRLSYNLASTAYNRLLESIYKGRQATSAVL